MYRAVLDVAGVPVAVAATDRDRAELVRAALLGFPDTEASPLDVITVDEAVVAVPSQPPRAEQFGIRLWEADDGVVVAYGGVVVEVEGAEALVHVPDPDAGSEHNVARDVDVVLPAALAWLLGRHGRFLIHGGAVARDDGALLVLGHSGKGKSTLVGGALERGWQVLSDDLVILSDSTDTGDGVQVVGLLQAPAVPVEIGGPIVASGTPLDGPRSRARLEPDVLTPGSRRVVGVVVVGHSDSAEGTLRPAPAFGVLALLLQSFAGSIDPRLRFGFFGLTEQLAGFPAWELGHAADVAFRRMHVDRALEECWRTAIAS